MNKIKRHLLSLALVLMLLGIPTVVAFAKELGSLTISGPGIEGEVTIDHAGGMMKLERSGFFDQSQFLKPPEKLGAGYDITAYLNLDGKVVPFVQMVYYAADENQPGYVHYTARLSGESLQPVDQWRQLNEEADTAFRGLMEAYKIALQPAFGSVVAAAPVDSQAIDNKPAVVEPVAEAVAEPVVAPAAATPAIASRPDLLIQALALAFFVVLGAGLILRRRTTSQRSPQM